MKRVLIVEDEKGIQTFIKECLLDVGYQVETADDGVAAIAKFHQSDFDLILLDVMLPKMDGFAVCEVIRLESTVPIIMLTALDEEENQLRGFDTLADDYICKPFSYRILLKRIEAVLRKTHQTSKQNILRIKDISLNLATYEVHVKNQAVVLTSIEFNLLKCLMAHPMQVLTREQLLEAVWGLDYYESSEKLVNHHIMNLRKKLQVDCIETVRGIGYRIVEKNS